MTVSYRLCFPVRRNMSSFGSGMRRAVIPEGKLEGYSGKVTIGIDAGSTTVKLVVVGEQDEILFSKYMLSNGKPVELVRETLQEIYQKNPQLHVIGSTATGYGEELVKNAFRWMMVWWKQWPI